MFIYDINCNLSSESAIYCGLILNELLTNSFKHAFDENKNRHCKYIFLVKTKNINLFIVIMEKDIIQILKKKFFRAYFN